MAGIENPLTAPLPSEVPLPDAPLVRVICQIRFPPVLSLANQDFIAPFQEAIRSSYPVLRAEQTQGILLGPLGVAPGSKQTAWRFSTADDTWRVSVTPEFIALETTAYDSRNGFLERLRTVLDAFVDHVEPASVQRLGLRYIDRVTGAELADISTLVRPEVLGILATPMGAEVRHALSDTSLPLPASDAQVQARWGRVPAASTIDPNAIEAIDEPSWVLDIDVFSGTERPFSPDQIIETARQYAEGIYRLFRWAVTDDFLRRYGGTL